MDRDNKNYNVDDILSEIKRKKSKSRPPVQEEAQDARLSDAVDSGEPFSPELPLSPLVGKEDRVKEFKLNIDDPDVDTPPVSFASPEAGGFAPKRTPVEETAPEKERRNPLDVSGHVRPITDKARIRQGYNRFASGASKPKPQQRGEFNFKIDEAPEGFLRDNRERENTKVLPKFSTGRELKLEDLQKLDYGPDGGSAHQAYDYDVTDEYEDDLPENSKVDFSEYNSESNRDDVAMDIAHTKLWLFIRMSLTAVLTFFSIYFMLSGKYGDIPMPKAIWPVGKTTGTFMAASTLLAVAVTVVNSSAVGGGLISFFKMRANADSLAAFALLASVAQGIVSMANPENLDPKAMSFFACVACCSMLFNSLGKMSMINRIQQNFRVLGSDREKHAVLAVDSPEFCRVFVPEATQRKPVIAYSAKSGFFTDFLSLSYSDKYDVGINRSVAPVCVIGALIVGISTYFLTEHAQVAIENAVSAITAILCICAVFSSTFIENVPLRKMAKKITPFGGMVSGSKAVEDFCDTNAVILTEKDIFGQGYVNIVGIKAFSQGRVDEAIVDAASVLCAINGALAPVFMQMINDNKKLLRKVENIVFENDMGLSAWIDSRRILIGNRRLMQNHGIPLPADSYERGEVENAVGEPLYLSNSGEVSARFLVEYTVNEELAVELDQLAIKEKKLIIYTNDANVSAHKIWEVYGYPEDLVTIMPTIHHKAYKAMSAPREDALAGIVYTGRATAMVKSVIACINARSSILSATVIGLVQMILGYGFIAFMAFMGAIGTLSSLTLLAYQLFWFVVIFIVQQIKQS